MSALVANGCKGRKNNFTNWSSENQEIDEIIKEIQTSSNIPEDFIEWIQFEQFENVEEIDEVSPILHCYGLIKSCIFENIEKYMLVIQFAEDSDLLKYLTKNFNKMKWLEDKLPILANIANGLKIIHKEGLIHSDLHCENI
ncbi:hypothetical protein C2G38_2199485 [Gigaspora rosea]|uniref:Protein kinase domain-containing protein n=1 Tax=Gigaspora rosea TaxID=44941 RepID=A0A397V0M7_9GLOM|nr:hypothetical protein C2G38_2199485 [Gigaspora rosea]